VLEAQQKAIDEHPDHQFYNLNIDAGSMWARRLIDRLVEKERPARAPIPIRPADSADKADSADTVRKQAA
jgi:vanillate O-demethylase monooxygenase subunit